MSDFNFDFSLGAIIGASVGALTGYAQGGANPDAAILALFANGEQGVDYDPSDFSTMWQDSARTTPVTAVNQPVGAINDKSGRGNHATQPLSSQRAVLRQDGAGKYCLQFDGVDDFYQTAAIDFSGTDKMTVLAGVGKTSDVAAQIICELSVTSNTNDGAFKLITGEQIGNAGFSASSRGTAANAYNQGSESTNTFPAPSLNVLTGLHNISAPSSILRVDGVAFPAGIGTQGTGNFGVYPLYVGSRGGAGLEFSGNLYRLTVRGALTAGDLLTKAEARVAINTGVTL